MTENRTAGNSNFDVPAVILASELFPPIVGGSAVLFANIYSRLRGLHVDLITEEIPLSPGFQEGFDRIVRIHIKHRSWSLLDATSRRRYKDLARAIVATAGGQPSIVHCARAIPEGVAAF